MAEELSFTRASASSHVSQPPLTQIQRLEEELEKKLIVRLTRRISPTPTEETLLPEALRILDESGHPPPCTRLRAGETQSWSDACHLRSSGLSLACLPNSPRSSHESHG
ncbi:LysR family transcriptional regulator [bacterium RCC_150]